LAIQVDLQRERGSGLGGCWCDAAACRGMEFFDLGKWNGTHSREQQGATDLDVIYFTEDAAEPLRGVHESRTALVALIEGCGDIDVSCLHLSPGAQICDLSITHDRAVLVLQGALVALAGAPRGGCVDLSPGMGVVLKPGERFQVIECPGGAVLLLVEAQWLDASRVGAAPARRVAGRRWPEEQ
jgi:hypothetical protein